MNISSRSTSFPTLVGQKILKIRRMTNAELNREGWTDIHKTTMALVLDNGTVVYASRDDEGNGPGTLRWWTGRP